MMIPSAVEAALPAGKASKKGSANDNINIGFIGLGQQAIYLMNGFQIRGLVRGFDNFTVIIENEGKQQLVYKHAISTISPATNITIMQPEKKEY